MQVMSKNTKPTGAWKQYCCFYMTLCHMGLLVQISAHLENFVFPTMTFIFLPEYINCIVCV